MLHERGETALAARVSRIYLPQYAALPSFASDALLASPSSNLLLLPQVRALRALRGAPHRVRHPTHRRRPIRIGLAPAPSDVTTRVIRMYSRNSVLV